MPEPPISYGCSLIEGELFRLKLLNQICQKLFVPHTSLSLQINILSTCTDTFGAKFATVNLSLLYTAKGTSAFLVPVANMIKTATGSWHMVFAVTAVMNIAVVGLALFVLKPMRRRLMTQSNTP